MAQRSRSKRTQRLAMRRRPAFSRPKVLLFEKLEDRNLLAGLQVTQVTPLEVRNTGFDHVDVTFSKAINAATFELEDVSITGLRGNIPVTDIQAIDAVTYRVEFAALPERGNYQLVVGSEILDLDGDRLDQDGDGTPGEQPEDTFSIRLVYVDANVMFDTDTTIAEGDTTFDGKHLLIDGATVAIDGQHGFGSVHIVNGGKLTHTPNTSSETHKLDLTVTQQVIVDSTSRIDVSGKGYLGGRTTGNTTDGGAIGEGGGSHGGVGAVVSLVVPGHETNDVYGDYANPSDWGAGGGVVGQFGGGAGGGVVRLSATTFVLDGALRAEGQYHGQGGSGAGGSILVSVVTLQGQGTISAAGGNGGAAGGGGGRAAVYAENLSGFDTSAITAAGGIASHHVRRGGPGTIYLRDPRQPHGTLIYDAKSGGNGWGVIGLPGHDVFTIPDAVRVTGGGTRVRTEHPGLSLILDQALTVDASAQLTVNGSVNLKKPTLIAAAGVFEALSSLDAIDSINIDGGVLSGVSIDATQVSLSNSGLLTSPNGTADIVYALELHVDEAVIVDSTSRIDVSGKGYLGGRTTGNTTDGGAIGEGGGSHGGVGGVASFVVPGHETNDVYGDYANPNDWGAGGGVPGRFGGGAGGGVVRILTPLFILEGSLRADGERHDPGGAGAGGSVFVSVTSLQGQGLISAAGGGGGNAAGGGGRIAVYAEDLSLFDISSITAQGGSSARAPRHGSPGTVYLRDPREPHGTLIYDAKDGGAGWTVIGLPGQDDFTISDAVQVTGARTRIRTEHLGMSLILNQTLTVDASAQLTVDGPINSKKPILVAAGGVLEAVSSLTAVDSINIDGGVLSGVSIDATQVSLSNSGLLTSPNGTADIVYALELDVDEAVIVDSTSRIDVSGKGYLGGRTTGNTTDGGAIGEGGGSHGGVGGVASLVAPGHETNDVYGDYANPSDWGAGGGVVGQFGGGAGGGVVRILTPLFILEGSLRADGERHDPGGAGAGGSVFVSVTSLQGQGLISAAGGGGGNAAGGGGRIAVYAEDLSLFDISSITAQGGSSARAPRHGSPGTVYLRDPRESHGTLIYDAKDGGAGWTVIGLPGQDEVTIPDVLHITGSRTRAEIKAHLTITQDMTINAGTLSATGVNAQRLVITSSGVLTAPVGTNTEVHKLALNVTDGIFVDATSSIDVSGRGYLPGYTSGNTPIGGARGNSGGSHGGLGGLADPSSTTNTLYGDYADPEDWGAGGSTGVNGHGTGGGVVRLFTSTLQLDGMLRADGNPNDARNGGGGAGGSVFISADIVKGQGNISAAGGGGRNAGGGGGRIAIYSGGIAEFDLDSISVDGGPHPETVRQGQSGTLHLINGELRTHVRTHTPLGSNNGYVNTALEYIDLHFNRPIDVTAFDASQFRVDGPLGKIVASAISEVGDRTYRVEFPIETENGRYHFQVLPTLLDTEGFPLDQDADGNPGEPEDIYQFTLILDTVAPRVSRHDPSGDITGTVNHLDVWFSETIDATTFTTSDVQIVDPNGASVAVSGITKVGLNRFRIAFDTLSVNGQYHVHLGPDVRDLAGNALDIDRDGAFGEPNEDVYDAVFNFVPVDLLLTQVTVNEAELVAGEGISLSWQGRNASGAALLGDWTDGVYLSKDDNWDIHDQRIATVDHVGGLADGAIYTSNATGIVPGALPGDYHILVRADVYNTQKELNQEGNNVLASGPMRLRVHQLTTDGLPGVGQLDAADRADYYRVQLEGGESLSLKLAADSPRAEMYVSYAAIPTRLANDHRNVTLSTAKEITLTGIAGGGTYYVLVYGAQANATVSYQLVGNVDSLFITSVTPSRHGSSVPAAVTIRGEGFDQQTSVVFEDPAGSRFSMPVQYVSPTTLLIPQLPGIPLGNYSVEVSKQTDSAILASAFDLIEGGTADLQVRLNGPGQVRPGFPIRQTHWLEYRNAGTVAMPAPLILVAARGGLITTDANRVDDLRGQTIPPTDIGNSVQIVGTGQSGTPGLLQPGESGRLPIYYVGQAERHPEQQADVEFLLGTITTTDTTEHACHLKNPSERVVIARPGTGERTIERGIDPATKRPKDVVWPFQAVRPRPETNGDVPSRTFRRDGAVGRGVQGKKLVDEPAYNCFIEFAVIDWDNMRESRPPSIPEEAWDAVLYNVRGNLGEEDLWADYVRRMADHANYLGSVGQLTQSGSDLWGFEIAEASASLNPIKYVAASVDVAIDAPGLPLTFSRVFANGIVPRFQQGTLGRGWSHNWDITLQLQSNGDVFLRGPGGADRFFVANGDGSYSASRGDNAQLERAADGFKLVESDRTVWQFGNGNGPLSYVEDTNGNRITLSHSFGRLISLTHSSGQSIALEYNISGHGKAVITKVTESTAPSPSTGRETTFSYEFGSDGPILTQVTAPGNRVTAYRYAAREDIDFQVRNSFGQLGLPRTIAGPRSFALLSVQYPDSRHDFYEYDSSGRLTTMKKDDDAEQIVFQYEPGGSIAVVDATSRATELRFGLGGQLAQVRDGDGRIIAFHYDDQFQLKELVGPGGERYRYAYDKARNLTGIRDALNLETTFAYDAASNRLASFLDARGNGIDYKYDDRGNLNSIVYIDGTKEQFTYDLFGNVVTATNRRDQTVTYSYDAAGRVIAKDYDTTRDVVDFTYEYDAAGNMTSATGDSGTTLMAYDASTDRLTRIDYPTGQFFTFGYDDVGRRTRRTDQDGNIVNYAYDSAGRLDQMTNEATQLIVDYDYDPAGRLARKTLGNSVYSTYEYDDAGHLINLVNYRPDDSVLSHFGYTYDVSGRRTSMTAKEGTYKYDYDALGQLVGVLHPDGRVVNYDYDEAGNRRQVIDDGVVTAYSTNDLNQYLTVGDTVYGYDLDGNQISKTVEGETTTYTYDIENHLVRVERETQTWEYSYDVFGNRTTNILNGEKAHYIIDPIGLGNIAADYDASGSLVARYEYGYGLLLRTNAAGEAGYYTFSAIGNTTELTDTSGATLNAYRYDPFGQPLGKSEAMVNPFEFVGEFGVMNEGNGLEFMRARYFDAITARFSQEDRIQVFGRGNLYMYGENSPTHFIDPEGLESRDAIDTIAFVGGLISTIKKVHPAVGFISTLLAGPGNEGNHLNCPATNYCRNVLIPEPGLSHKPSVLRPLDPPFDPAPTDLGHLIPPPHPYNPTPQPDFTLDGSVSVNEFRSHDPNDKLSSAGFGHGHFVQVEDFITYTIRFENQSTATAPAQQIVITDTVYADLDLETLELSEIAFANQRISVPAGLSHYRTTLPIQANATDILVEVRVDLDRQTREFVLTLEAIDPQTGWAPEDPLTGLLYPNDDSGRGEGHISFVVKPSQVAASGTQIRNRASIVFDYNDPILTPEVLNTIDAGRPTSAMVPLPLKTNDTTVVLQWNGQDDEGGSGVGSYDVFVSIDGGPYTRMVSGALNTSAEVQLEAGRSYAFYSIATDNVGHVELTPDRPDTFIAVVPWQNLRDPLDVNDDGRITPIDVLLAINFLNQFGPGRPTGGEGTAPFLDTNGDSTITPVDVLRVINFLNSRPAGEAERNAFRVPDNFDELARFAATLDTNTGNIKDTFYSEALDTARGCSMCSGQFERYAANSFPTSSIPTPQANRQTPTNRVASALEEFDWLDELVEDWFTTFTDLDWLALR